MRAGASGRLATRGDGRLATAEARGDAEDGDEDGFGDGWGSIGPGGEQRGSGRFWSSTAPIFFFGQREPCPESGPRTSATRTPNAADGRRTLDGSPVGN